VRRTALTRKATRRPPAPPAARAWTRAARLSRCAVCNRQAHQGHHVIYKQHLRRRADAEKLLWDLRNMLPICARCHEHHHRAFRRIRQRELTTDAIEFAAELGLDWLIEREYPA
jgi:5-methylcytosine-specific restriction endonuclease McrA